MFLRRGGPNIEQKYCRIPKKFLEVHTTSSQPNEIWSIYNIICRFRVCTGRKSNRKVVKIDQWSRNWRVAFSNKLFQESACKKAIKNCVYPDSNSRRSFFLVVWWQWERKKVYPPFSWDYVEFENPCMWCKGNTNTPTFSPGNTKIDANLKRDFSCVYSEIFYKKAKIMSHA